MKPIESHKEGITIKTHHQNKYEGNNHGRGRRHDPNALLKRIGVVQNLTVADLGCGEGYFALPMASLVGEGGVVYTVDVDADSLLVLKGNLDRLRSERNVVRIIKSDARQCGIPENSVDIVFMAKMLHNIKDKEAILRETRRILNPSGSVVILDWLRSETLFGPPPAIRISEEQVRKLFEKSGFSVADEFQPDQYHYCIRFELFNQEDTKIGDNSSSFTSSKVSNISLEGDKGGI